MATATAMEGANTTAVKAALTDGVMLSLEMCSEALHQHRPEHHAGDLTSLREAIVALDEELQASSVDDELKEFLNRLVRAMLRAVDEYPFRGQDGLQSVFEQAVGALTRVRGDLAARTVEHHPKLWERIETVL